MHNVSRLSNFFDRFVDVAALRPSAEACWSAVSFFFPRYAALFFFYFLFLSSLAEPFFFFLAHGNLPPQRYPPFRLKKKMITSKKNDHIKNRLITFFPWVVAFPKDRRLVDLSVNSNQKLNLVQLLKTSWLQS